MWSSIIIVKHCFYHIQWSSSSSCCTRRGCGHWIYLVYRWFLVLYFYSWLVYSGINDGPRFFIYLTNWSYLAWCCYLLSSAISTSIGVIRTKWCAHDDLTEREPLLSTTHPSSGATDSEIQQTGGSNENQHRHENHDRHRRTSGIIVKVQWLCQMVHWVSFYLGVNMALFVTPLFWVVVYGISRDITNLTPGIYNFHGVNALFALIDIFVTGVPMKILHVVYPIIFGTCYAVFSVIYYHAHGTDGMGHRYVYSALNWCEPLKALGFVLLSVVVEVVLYTGIYGLYRIRLQIISKVQSRE